MNLFDLACGVPWLILEDSLRQMLTILADAYERRQDIEAVAASAGVRPGNTRFAEVRDGVGVLNVRGPIFRHGGLFADVCGVTTTERLSKDFQALLDNPQAKSILLAVDSPGGQAAGIEELAAMVREGAARKPVAAHIDGVGASAAYWIASGAREVALGKTAMAGSIGAIMNVRDDSEKLSRDGVRDLQFVSSVSPDKRPDLATDDGKAKVQAIVDALGDEFVSAVAAHRGIDRDRVLAVRGGLRMGKAAVEAGLADRVETFEATLKRLAAGGGPTKATTVAAGGVPMPLTQNPDGTPLTVEQLQARIAELEGRESETNRARFDAEVNAFVATLGDRLTPETSKGWSDALLQARIDDAADGGARFAGLQALARALPEHRLTESEVDANGDVIAKYPAASGDEDFVYGEAIAARDRGQARRTK